VFLSCGLTIVTDIGILALLRGLQIKITNIRIYIDSIEKTIGKQHVFPMFRPGIWIVIGILSIFLFLIYYIILTAPMVSYLREILSGIERIKNGDLNTEIPVRSGGELGELALAINAMRLELKTMDEKQREMEHVKDELITNVAHDLRTPLTSIIGYLDLLRTQEQLPRQEQRKYIDIAYDKSSRMEGLVEDLFDFTRYDKNKLELDVCALDLRQFMEQVIDEFYPSLTEQGLECYTVFAPEVVLIDGDGELLARAFCNLMGNAVKYGREGKQIRVEVGTLPNQNMARVAIINYGRIIPRKDIEHIFDKFYRGDYARSTVGGTGLGLAIAKKIFEMHGGTIDARSDEQGTVFEVILPLIEGKEDEHESEEGTS
jgi:signal transduction histidine kinase